MYSALILIAGFCLATGVHAQTPRPAPLPTPEERASPQQRAGLPASEQVRQNSVIQAYGKALLDMGQLDAYIQKGMEDWQIPGLAIAVVKDGKTVYMRGFGTRAVGKAEPVDSATQFMIASNTKLFTGTAISNLVQQKRLALDDKITKFFPDFRLYDSLSTQLVSVRDMLTHRIGTKTFQGDFTYLDGNISRQEIMRRMRYMKPIGPFRQDYGYCNSCYLVAGQVVEKVTGKPWEAYVTDSILRPLRMARTTALGNDAPTHTNIAKPYTTSYTNKLTEVPYDIWDNLAPAASIISTASDMRHWLLFQLDSGRFEGRRVMPWAALQRTRDVQVMQGSRKNPRFPSHFRGYGLGVGVSDYNGRQVYSHTGGAVGMVSGTCFVPEERLGIVILTNNDNQSFFELLRYHLLDHYLGVENAPDRSAAALPAFNKEMQAQVDTIAAWRAKAVAAAKAGKPVLPALGIYKNLQYGTITLSKAKKGHGLEVSFGTHPALKARLAWMGGDKWLAEYNNIEYGIYPATVGTSNGKSTLTLQVNDFLEMDPYVFVAE